MSRTYRTKPANAVVSRVSRHVSAVYDSRPVGVLTCEHRSCPNVGLLTFYRGVSACEAPVFCSEHLPR